MALQYHRLPVPRAEKAARPAQGRCRLQVPRDRYSVALSIMYMARLNLWSQCKLAARDESTTMWFALPRRVRCGCVTRSSGSTTVRRGGTSTPA